MEPKKYVVGEFIDQSVECFPRIWLREELEVLWPTGLGKKAIQHAIINVDEPKEDWEVHQLRRVLAQLGKWYYTTYIEEPISNHKIKKVMA